MKVAHSPSRVGLTCIGWSLVEFHHGSCDTEERLAWKAKRRIAH